MFTSDKLEIGTATGAGVIFIGIRGHMYVNLRIRNEEKFFDTKFVIYGIGTRY